MRLLVTRPEPDATALKAHLVASGHEVIVEPLLSLDLSDADPIPSEGVQALIATSRNAVRAAAVSPDRDALIELPIFAVGSGTALAARDAGFATVLRGDRDAASLLPVIAERAEVNGGALVYLSGEARAFDLPGELRRLGFHVLEPVVYAMRPAECLSGSTLARILDGRIEGVLLFSPQTARIWLGLLRAHDLDAAARGLVHFCLSDRVAQCLAPLAPARTVVARLPNLQDMLAAIRSAAT